MNCKRLWRVLFATLLLGALTGTGCSSGTHGDASQLADPSLCARGVSTQTGCKNPDRCDADDACLDGFSCRSNTCTPRVPCNGPDDTTSCGGGACVAVGFVDGKSVNACQNPASCDRTKHVPLHCIPTDYCTSSGVCLPADKACPATGCSYGVCGLSGCENRPVCVSDVDCLEDYLCSSKGTCVSKEGDTACDNKCGDSGTDGGVCDRFRGICVNIDDPSCTGDRCSCSVSALGSCPTQPQHYCLVGYHWEATKQSCEKNTCQTTDDCTSGGVCNTTTGACEEPATCTSNAQCSAALHPRVASGITPKPGVSSDRVCAKVTTGAGKTCFYLDEECARRCPGEQQCRLESDVVTCDNATTCTSNLDCVSGYYCDKNSHACKDVASGSSLCTPHYSSQDDTQPSVFNWPKKEVDVTVCDKNLNYFRASSNYFSSGRLRITVVLDRVDIGLGVPVVTAKVVDGGASTPLTVTPDISRGDLSAEGSWSFILPTETVSSGDVIFSVSFHDAREEVIKKLGLHYALYLDKVDVAAADACESATPLKVGSDGTSEVSGKIEKIKGPDNFDIWQLCPGVGSRLNLSTDLYKVTLTERKWVKIIAGPLDTKTDLLLAVQRGCSVSPTRITHCSSDRGASYSESFTGYLEPGDYTIAVSSANEDGVGKYALKYEEKAPNCDPDHDVSCSADKSELTYCDVASNGQVTKSCGGGGRCDEMSRSCKEDKAFTCTTAEYVDLTAESSFTRDYELSLFDKEHDAEKSEITAGGCPGLAEANTLGNNLFFRVKIPKKSWMVANLGTSAGATSTGPDYSVYILEHCGDARCISSSDKGGANEKEGAFYYNDSDEPKEVIVVADSAKTTDYPRVTVSMSILDKEPCKVGDKLCFENRFVKACGVDGKMEVVKVCNPRAGCNPTTAQCNPTPGDSCPAPDIVTGTDNGTPNITNRIFTDQYLDSMESDYRATVEDCDPTIPTYGLDNNDPDAVYMVNVPGGGTSQNIVVRVTSKYPVILWEVGCPKASGASLACRQFDLPDHKNYAGDYLTELTIQGATAGNHYFAVQGGIGAYDDREKYRDLPFTIESKVGKPDPNCSDPYDVTCDSGVLKKCVGGLLFDVGCSCKDKNPYCESTKTKPATGYSCFDPISIERKDSSGAPINGGTISLSESIFDKGKNSFNVRGREGTCYFAEETWGTELIYAISLKQGETVQFTISAPGISPDYFVPVVRPYFLTKCRNISTCSGFSGFENFSDKEHVTTSYHADKDEEVFFVFDTAGRIYDPMELSWEILSSATTCVPGRAACDGSNQIKYCNAVGDGYDTSLPCSADGNSTCDQATLACTTTEGGKGSYCNSSPNNAIEITSGVDYFLDPVKTSGSMGNNPTASELLRGEGYVFKVSLEADQWLSVETETFSNSDGVEDFSLFSDANVCSTPSEKTLQLVEKQFGNLNTVVLKSFHNTDVAKQTYILALPKLHGSNPYRLKITTSHYGGQFKEAIPVGETSSGSPITGSIDPSVAGKDLFPNGATCGGSVTVTSGSVTHARVYRLTVPQGKKLTATVQGQDLKGDFALYLITDPNAKPPVCESKVDAETDNSNTGTAEELTYVNNGTTDLQVYLVVQLVSSLPGKTKYELTISYGNP